MTIRLPETVERSVNAAVQSGRFPTVDDALAAAWLAFETPPMQGQQTTHASQVEGTLPAPASEKPVWEIMDELRMSVPPEEFAKLPRDGASQHDYYIYGSPKRQIS